MQLRSITALTNNHVKVHCPVSACADGLEGEEEGLDKYAINDDT